MTLAIVGIGLIGGSIGLSAKATNAATHIIGIEPDASTWADALATGAVDEITDDLAAGVQNAELVILAAPVAAILDLLPRLAPLLRADAVVSDTGSVKGAIAEVGNLALGGQFIPGHPMAGGELGGVRQARADLFRGATWAITPADEADTGAVGRVAAFVSALGAVPLILAPGEHDAAVALTSHLPHVLAYALSAMARRQAGDGDVVHRLTAGSWVGATRVAAADPAQWATICYENRAALAPLLDALAGDLREAAALLRAGDARDLRGRFEAGNQSLGR